MENGKRPIGKIIAKRLFPDEVQDEIGYALHCAQMGNTYSLTKMFKGHGSGLMQMNIY